MEEETIVECEDCIETMDLAERVVTNILGTQEETSNVVNNMLGISEADDCDE